MEEYANNAYKTAGLSASEYMETVTGFSASLLQSLDGDTEAAAKAADMAITDMADNANKMGTSISSIENAYQGFAKQNYTMLDNLKLGYGGTKSEMERLLKDATKLSGVEYDISNLNDVYEAIHVIQTEMGITGTTAQESSETIEGSVSAMKSAWSNFVVGIAEDNADIGGLITNLVDSAKTALNNILPRVKTILANIVVALQDFIPVIAQELPSLILDLLPSLIEGVSAMLIGLANQLPTMVSVIIDNLPAIFKLLVQTIVTLVPQLITAIINTLKTALPKLFEAGKEMISYLWDGIKNVWGNITNWINEKMSWLLNKLGNFASVSGLDGSHAAGLNYVPYDGYVAELHRGETVLNAGNTQSLKDDIVNGIKDALGGGIGNQTIVVQSVLDGRVIGEKTYKFAENKTRMYGV